MRIHDSRPAPDALADIATGSAGPQVGAFFDLDGTLVAGFTATAHCGRPNPPQAGRNRGGSRCRRAMMRYRFGRMQFERLVLRGGGYLRGESLADLEGVGEGLFIDRIEAV